MTTCWGGLGCQRHKSGSVGGFRRRVCAFFFFFFSLLVMYHNNLTPDMDSDSPTCRTESPVGTLCQKTPEEASSPASSSESSAKVWMALLIIYSTCSRKLTPPPFMQVSLCLLSWRWGEGEGELIDTILINLRLILFFFFLFKSHFWYIWYFLGGGAGGSEISAGGNVSKYQHRSGCYDSDVLGPNVSVSMQRFIEKNKSIQETPQHPCVSVDVRNNDKVKYWSEGGYFWWGIFQEYPTQTGYPLFETPHWWFIGFYWLPSQ